MAWQIPVSTTSTTVIAYLGVADDVIVRPDVTLEVLNFDPAIEGHGSGHSVLVYGTVISGGNTIFLGDAGIDNSVFVAARGTVRGGNSAVVIKGDGAELVNEGVIEATNHAIIFDTRADDVGRIVNTGFISGGSTSFIRNLTFSTGTVILENNGVMIGDYNGRSDVVGVDSVTNTGVIIGDVLLGGGDDTYDGADGEIDGDVLGGDGNDTVTGGREVNTIFGDAGNDRLIGGLGGDTIEGGDGDDSLNGGSGHDTLGGGVGDDVLVGGGSNDTLDGGHNSDRLLGGSNEDTLVGGGGNDVLDGGNGEDSLSGTTGDDILTGGADRDTLIGGSGVDTYVFNSVADSGTHSTTRDIIAGFGQAAGEIIDLETIDANVGVAGNQAFSFIGASAFTGAAGQLRYEHISGNTFIYGDVNGDGAADFSIRADGITDLLATDFIL